MSWVAILWPMIASACLTLAWIHVLVWFRNRTAWANLLFSLTAVASAAAAEALGCTAYFLRTDSGTDVLEAIRRVAV
jgi:hypothetical protein